MIRTAFSRLILRAAGHQRRHCQGGKPAGKKGPFAKRDKPMPEKPEEKPAVLSKKDKRISDLRSILVRYVDRKEHRMKGYDKLTSFLADCQCDEQRRILVDKLQDVVRKINEDREEITKVELELWTLGAWIGAEEWIGGGGDVSDGGGDETGGGDGMGGVGDGTGGVGDVRGGGRGVDGTGVGGDGGGEGEVSGGGIN